MSQIEPQPLPLTIENVLEFEKHIQEVSKAKAELAKEEQKFNNTLRKYKQLSYADPMELAKVVLIERQRAAFTIQKIWRERRKKTKTTAHEQYKLKRRAVKRIIRMFRKWRAYFDAKKARYEREEFSSASADKFYAPITGMRAKEIAAELDKRRGSTTIDTDAASIEKLNNRYCEKYKDFLQKQPDVEIDRLLRYHSYSRMPDLLALLGNKNDLKKGKIYELPDTDNKELSKAKEEHSKRVKAYTANQQWRFLVEDDEVDIEGDRLLGEIRNDRFNRLASEEEF